MKRSSYLFFSLLLCFSYFFKISTAYSFTTSAQNPIVDGMCTSHGTVFVDNEFIKTWRAVIPPYCKSDLHRHTKPRVVTVLKGGYYKILNENKEVVSYKKWHDGDVIWLDVNDIGTLHYFESLNDYPMEIVITEVNIR